MNTTWILIKREFIERVRQRSFVVATLLGMIGIVLLAFMPAVFGSFAKSSATRLGIVGPDAKIADQVLVAVRPTGDRISILQTRSAGPDLPPSARSALDKDQFDAVLVAYRDARGALGFTYYPKSAASLQDGNTIQRGLQDVVLRTVGSGALQRAVQRAEKFPFAVKSLNTRFKSEGEEFFATAIVYVLLIILYIAVLVYGVQVAMGVIEEKANRIMEIMIGAVRPSQLLAGKIFGISAVALVQLVLNAIGAAIASVIAGVMYAPAAQQMASSPASQAAVSSVLSQGLPHVPWSTLGYLIVFFFLAFYSYSALYAGIGSLLSKPEEVQQYSIVFMLPFIAAYLLAIFALSNPDAPFVMWGSLIPLISPLLMFTRIALVPVPWWQIAASVGLSLLTIWGLTILAGKLYRVGVLMYGKPPSVKEIWRALRAPA
ncbi:MAG TPA: ABC transporter permease [Candidatus Eremiobacteraceae bacterium]|nr:ABC transporter permease [Candidatus Eremiobacteraceae bacterium]